VTFEIKISVPSGFILHTRKIGKPNNLEILGAKKS
jgi:hypothetical protein